MIIFAELSSYESLKKENWVFESNESPAKPTDANPISIAIAQQQHVVWPRLCVLTASGSDDESACNGLPKFIQDTAAQLTDRTEKTKQKGMKSQEWRIKKIPKVIVPSDLIISSST